MNFSDTTRTATELGAVIARAETPVLYEGLPDDGWEFQLGEREKQTKPVRRWERYFFYRDPVALSAGHAQALATLMTDPGTYVPYVQNKLCGGFHPDFALRWHCPGEGSWFAFIGFGCGEIKLKGPELRSHHDFAELAENRLHAILDGYQQNRPAAEMKFSPTNLWK